LPVRDADVALQPARTKRSRQTDKAAAKVIA